MRLPVVELDVVWTNSVVCASTTSVLLSSGNSFGPGVPRDGIKPGRDIAVVTAGTRRVDGIEIFLSQDI